MKNEVVEITRKINDLAKTIQPYKMADRLTEPEKSEVRKVEARIRGLKVKQQKLLRPGGFEVNETIRLHSLESIGRAMERLKRVPLSPLHEVTIRPAKKVRSSEQNRLLWKWNTEIGTYFGLTKEEAHEMLKEKFLLNIFVRDDTDYARMATAILQVKNSSRDDYYFLRKKVIELTSTTKCSVTQMAEYLTSIKMFAAQEYVPITIPEDKELQWILDI